MATPLNGPISPIPGYTIEDIVWKVQTFPGRPHVLMSGTVQSVFNQLRYANPNFEADFGINLATSNLNASHSEKNNVPLPNITQEHYDVLRHDCFGAWPSASLPRIQEGISYLRGLPGQPSEPPGPMACGRVSCSWDAAIWWCNDVGNYASFPNLNPGVYTFMAIRIY